MAIAHGYKATYQYVELTVERQGDHWRLILMDTRHNDRVEHDETFETAGEAKDAALSVAQHHINILHNDTLLMSSILSWHEY
jgi:hypothetical protein